ncbi:unnamed protein product [Meganyctiphanes norvegica]|uniref:Uncharacterized protein n=1 Tax=Meganyctiphanes norvegica TaxID=48144 RepID=A0AAV2RDB2_MEGNR
MFNPQVVKFPAPASLVQFEKYPWNSNTNTRIQKLVNNHHYNIQISLLVPDTPSLPQEILDSLLEDTQYYKVLGLPVVEFCKTEFLQLFVRRGSISGISIGVHLDQDNCACITPGGQIYLSLDRESYQALGINGKLAPHILREPKNRYVVKIDTGGPGFIPGTDHYDRTINCLKNANLLFDFYITWSPHDESVCPSSIAKYLSERGYKIIEKQSEIKQTQLTDIHLPVLVSEKHIDRKSPTKEIYLSTEKNQEEEDEIIDPEELLEWIGTQHLAVNLGTDISSTLSIVQPSPSSSISNLKSVNCTGFYTSLQIEKIILLSRQYLSSRSESAVPWLCLTIYGSPDALVCWGSQPHTYLTNGDNFYTMVIARDQIWLYTVKTSQKPQRLYVKSSNK